MLRYTGLRRRLHALDELYNVLTLALVFVDELSRFKPRILYKAFYAAKVKVINKIRQFGVFLDIAIMEICLGETQ